MINTSFISVAFRSLVTNQKYLKQTLTRTSLNIYHYQSARNMTSTMLKVKGLVSAPCTAFKQNGDVNYDIIPAYVDHLLQFGVPNVFLTGTTGEGLSLTVTERKAVVEAWMKHARNKLSTIIVQIGCGNLRDSQELARHARDVGADAVACVSPTYYKPPTLECYVSYMAEVASAVPDLPFLLYDIDFVTGVQFNTNEFFHCASSRISNLCGIKHTSPSFPNMDSILQDHGDRFTVLIGTNETYLEALAIGIETTVMHSHFGIILNNIKAAFDKGDMVEARKQQGHALALSKLNRKHGLSYATVASVPLKALGLDMGQPRLPMAPYTDETVEAYKKDLKEIGFFDWGMSSRR